MRLVAGIALSVTAINNILLAPIGPAIQHVLAAAAGILLFLGLWTPIVGPLVLILELLAAFSQSGDDPWVHVLVATLGAALALLGTAVGFILMLIPIAGLTSFDVDTLRKALSGMSSGMAVALNITVTGIGTALLLKLQYYFLATGVVDLYDMITEVTEVHVISALEHDRDG